MIYVSKANTFIDKTDNTLFQPNVEGFKTVNFKNMTLWPRSYFCKIPFYKLLDDLTNEKKNLNKHIC